MLIIHYVLCLSRSMQCDWAESTLWRPTDALLVGEPVVSLTTGLNKAAWTWTSNKRAAKFLVACLLHWAKWWYICNDYTFNTCGDKMATSFSFLLLFWNSQVQSISQCTCQLHGNKSKALPFSSPHLGLRNTAKASQFGIQFQSPSASTPHHAILQ